MNLNNKKVLGLENWVHIVLSIVTCGFWLVVYFACKSKMEQEDLRNKIFEMQIEEAEKKKKNEELKKAEKEENKPTCLYSNEFVIDNSDDYQENISKILEAEKSEMEFYDGLSSKEIRESLEDYLDEIGEIDECETPDVKLYLNENKTSQYISVKIYNKNFDKYLTVGKIPKEYEESLIKLLDKNVLIWGSYVGGKFKAINNNGKITTINKPIQIKLLIKIFDK